MSDMRVLIEDAIGDLCARFERGGYNPTPVIDIGVLVASADGKVDDDERAFLLDVFETLLETRLSAELVDLLITASLEVISAAGVEPRARLVAEILKDCDAVEPGLTVALAVAYASCGLSAAERGVIETIANAAHVAPGVLDELVESVRKRVPDQEAARDSLNPRAAARRSLPGI